MGDGGLPLSGSTRTLTEPRAHCSEGLSGLQDPGTHLFLLLSSLQTCVIVTDMCHCEWLLLR